MAEKQKKIPTKRPKLILDRAERRAMVINQLGLHLRAAASFIKVANRFQADISVEMDGKSVNGKSIMSIMSLAAASGSMLIIKATGPDSVKAADALVKLVAGKFGEKE